MERWGLREVWRCAERKVVQMGFIVVLLVGGVCLPVVAQEVPSKGEQGSTLYQRQALLGRIEVLSEHIRHHHDLEQGGLMDRPGYELLTALAGGLAVSMVNGGALSGITRVLSPLMASQGGFMAQGAAYSLYSGVALIVAWQVLRYTGHGRALPLAKHVQYALESVGMGQLLGVASWMLSSFLWPVTAQYGPSWLVSVLDRASRLPNYDPLAIDPLLVSQWLDYNHASHFLIGAFIGGIWYYLSRTIISSDLVDQQLWELEDELAVSRMLLRRLESTAANVRAEVALEAVEGS